MMRYTMHGIPGVEFAKYINGPKGSFSISRETKESARVCGEFRPTFPTDRSGLRFSMDG